jgi:hypothetical protein
MILKDTCNTTSSQVPGAGHSGCGCLVGEMIAKYGRGRAPASPSAPPAKEPPSPTPATSGPSGSDCSANFALQSSLESRLRTRLDGVGSTLFSLTWKAKATPVGRPYYQLVASALRTSGNGCGSWLSPSGFEAPGLTLWQAALVWTNWPTPTVHDANRGGQAKRAAGETRHGSNLQDFVMLASWAAPSARDFKSNEGSEAVHQARAEQTHGKPLSEQVHQLASGPTSTGSPAPTEKRGQLSPDHSRWLMGYSAEHLSCAPMEMPSSRKPRRRS